MNLEHREWKGRIHCNQRGNSRNNAKDTLNKSVESEKWMLNEKLKCTTFWPREFLSSDQQSFPMMGECWISNEKLQVNVNDENVMYRIFLLFVW